MKKLILFLFLVTVSTCVFAQKSPRTPERKASMLSEKMATNLSLTTEQKKKVYDLTLNNQKSKDVLSAKSAGDDEALKAALRDLRKSYNDSLKVILTPEQFARWQQEKKEKRGKKHEGIDKNK